MNGILVHPKTKEEANLIVELFDKMNINYEVNVGSHKVIAKKLAGNTPNVITRKAINEARAGKGKRFTSLTGLFDELKQ